MSEVRRLPEMNGEHRAFVLKAYAGMASGEIHKRVPHVVHQANGAADERPIWKANFRAMQPSRGENERRKNTVDAVDRAPADKGKRATRRLAKPGEQCAQMPVRGN